MFEPHILYSNIRHALLMTKDGGSEEPNLSLPSHWEVYFAVDDNILSLFSRPWVRGLR